MLLNLDARSIPITDGGKAILFPLAEYPVEVIKAEDKPVKDKPSQTMLVYTLRTLQAIGTIPIGTEHSYNLNLFSDNDTAARIARESLVKMQFVSGRLQLQTSEQMVGARFVAVIGPQDNNDKYSEVKLLKDFNGRTGAEIANAPAQSATAQAPAQQMPAQPPPAPAAFAQQPAAAPAFGQPAAAPPAFGNGGVPAAAPWKN
jgi:hypothetical protein